MENNQKITPIEEKMARDMCISTDYKLLRKVGKKKSEIVIIIQDKYNIQKSLVYQIIKKIELNNSNSINYV